MKQKQTSLSRVIVAGLLVASVVLQGLTINTASAAQISNRSLTLLSGATDGGSKPGGVVRHQFAFTLPTAGNVGSIRFQYCTLAAGTCVKPTGLDTLTAALDAQSGVTGFTLDTTVDGAPYLTRPAAPTAGNDAVSYTLSNVTNPTATNQSFYVRITTYESTNATGSSVDSGNVVASTATPIDLTGIMPESLVFCTGGTVSTTSGVPDCTTATGGAVSFNQLFSATDTAIASSQMAASTNAGFGYAITVNGTTLTSGSNTVTEMTTAGASIKGVSQFGMNLKANTAAAAVSFPGSSAEVAPAANGTNYKGWAPTGSGYDLVDTFKFTTADVIAASTNGGPGGTDAQIFTKSYIVNVPGSQPAGTYTTTLTYICTPTF